MGHDPWDLKLQDFRLQTDSLHLIIIYNGEPIMRLSQWREMSTQMGPLSLTEASVTKTVG